MRSTPPQPHPSPLHGYHYGLNDIPCYSQANVRSDVSMIVGPAGCWLMNLLGIEDYLRSRPPETDKDGIANRILGVRAPGTSAKISHLDLPREAGAFKLTATPAATGCLLGSNAVWMAYVPRWRDLVRAGPSGHWVTVRESTPSTIEVNDVAWTNAETGWSAVPWAAGPRGGPPDLYGAVRLIPPTELLPRIAPGSTFVIS